MSVHAEGPIQPSDHVDDEPKNLTRFSETILDDPSFTTWYGPKTADQAALLALVVEEFAL